MTVQAWSACKDTCSLLSISMECQMPCLITYSCNLEIVITPRDFDAKVRVLFYDVIDPVLKWAEFEQENEEIMQQFVDVLLVFTQLLTNSILNKKNKKEKASNSVSYPDTVCRMASFASALLLVECRSLGCTTLDVCPFGRCPHCVFDTTSLLKIRYCARLSA